MQFCKTFKTLGLCILLAIKIVSLCTTNRSLALLVRERSVKYCLGHFKNLVFFVHFPVGPPLDGGLAPRRGLVRNEVLKVVADDADGEGEGEHHDGRVGAGGRDQSRPHLVISEDGVFQKRVECLKKKTLK